MVSYYEQRHKGGATELTRYADIADYDEDTRIEIIGRTVTEQQKMVAFVTDSDSGKSDRYIEKLLNRYPGVMVIERLPGLVANTVTVKLGPKHAHGIE